MLSHWITQSGAKTGAEVGVASGFSSSVIFAAMAGNSPNPQLYSFDISPQCYFDPSRNTGDAFYEVHGKQPGFHLRTGVTSADITDGVPQLDFIFIDGSHATPWPALDVLSLGRFLKPGGWIALDDLDMMFADPRYHKGKNGARDLFRAWKGPKAVYKRAPGLGILWDVTPEVILRGVHHSLLVDWDQRLSAEHLQRFGEIATSYGTSDADRLRRALRAQRNSSRHPTPSPLA